MHTATVACAGSLAVTHTRIVKALQVYCTAQSLSLSPQASPDTSQLHSQSPQASADISQLSPLLQRQWDHSKNAHLGDMTITPFSGRRAAWTCDQCPTGHDHSWDAVIANRSYGAGCPYCAGRSVCHHNSLSTKAPAVAAQFSSKNKGTADDYTSCSHKKVTWQCEHGHEWDATMHMLTVRKRGCPVCAEIKKATASRAKPRLRHPVLTESQRPMMQLWDHELNAKAGLEPEKITCRSKVEAHWICHCCPKGQIHRWQARVGNVYDGSGCPYCAGRSTCSCNSLEALFPELAAEWDHGRNIGTPSDYTAFSNAQVWWLTRKRGSYRATISSRTAYVRRQEFAKG